MFLAPHVIPVKRIDLLLEGLVCWAQLIPQQFFIWTHIGDGKSGAAIREKASQNTPPNLKCNWLGRLSNLDVLEFYRLQPIDIFINTSVSEGVPVSIMQAYPPRNPHSGNICRWNPGNRFFRKMGSSWRDPSPEEIADFIQKYLNKSRLWSQKRKHSREVWQKKFDIKTNSSRFINIINGLQSSKISDE